MTVSAAPSNSTADVLRGYLALTKPRIIELLLVTTVPTMIVAANGFPRLWLIVATLVGGTLAAGGANAFNMVIDRDIDALMERTKRRPLVTGVMSAARRHSLPLGSKWSPLGARRVGQSTLGVARDLGDGVLRRRLHDGLEASLEAEHRHRGRRWRGTGAGGLGCRHELAWMDAGAVVPRHLHLDPAAFLGVGGALPRRLPRGQRSDDAGCRVLRRTTLEILIYSVLLWALTLLIGPSAHLGWVYAISATVLGGMFTWSALRLYRHARTDKADVAEAMRLFHFSITYLSALFVLMAVDVLVRHH